MEEETKYELTEQYWAQQLTGAELVAFEKRLQADPKFAEQVQLFQGMEKALSDPKAIALQEKLNQIGNEFMAQAEPTTPPPKKKAKVVPMYKKPWAIAATVLLAATAGGGLWQMQATDPLTNDQLFAQNYEVYQLDGLVRGTQDEEELANALQLYQNKAYENAAEVLAILNAEDIDNQKVMFALANAYLNQEPPQLEKAATFFNQLIDMNTSVYVPKAQWYLALIYLKQNKLEQAKLLLTEVKNSGDSYAEEAKEVLERLN